MADQKNFYVQSLEKLFRSQKTSYVVQIGANDGRINDPIFDVVMRHRATTRILLIEPQPELLPHLRENYRLHPNAVIWNGAIGPNDSLSLFRVKPDYYDVFIKRYLLDSPSYRVPSGFTSSVRDHVIRHTAGNIPPGVELSDAIEEIVVPCTTLDGLLKQLKIEERVDVIQIDTEGMDDVVLYACNLSKLMPSLINFEHAHIPDERLKALSQYLSKLDYKLYRWSRDDTLAIKTPRTSYSFKLPSSNARTAYKF